MNTYQAFYNNKSTEIQADTSYSAQQKAAIFFKVKPKNEYKIAIVLCELENKPVIHSTAEF